MGSSSRRTSAASRSTPTPRSRSCPSFSTTRPPIRCSRRWSPSAAPGSRRARASTTGADATSRRCTGKPRPSSPSCSNSCGAESARRRRERGRRPSRGSGSGGRALLPAHGDVAGLVAVLLEEEPLQDLRSKQALGGQEGRSLRQIVEDRIGLREIDPSFDLEDRNLAVRVLGEKGRRPRLLVENVDVHPLVRPLELGEQQLDLVTVPRLQIPVDAQHATPPGLTPSTRSAMNTLSSYSPSNFRARRLMPSVTKPDAR